MNKSLRNKILITLGFLFAYRLLAYVSVPGVDVEVIKQFFQSNSNNAFGMFNMFSGNAAKQFSVISLGIMPYITASIIMETKAKKSKAKDTSSWKSPYRKERNHPTK